MVCVCASSKLHMNNRLDASRNICHLLDLLVDNDANSMLGYVVHASRLTMVALVRHSFLNGTCALKRNAIMQRCTYTTTMSPF